MVDKCARANGVRFIILAAARTGSNLLRGLLHSHPQCFVGGELFNHVYFDRRYIPWCPDWSSDERAKINHDDTLIDLRKADPVRFIERLFEITRHWGHQAIGFKLMYWHPEMYKEAGDYLVGDTSIRVIHLKRRNLLRR